MLPSINGQCGTHFTYRDFIECSDSWKRTRVDNVPQQIDTYQAIDQITREILDLLFDGINIACNSTNSDKIS